jgi:hypothetical protein
MTDLKDLNEPFVASANSFETRGMNTIFGNSMTEIFSITDLEQQYEITTYT